MRLTPYFIPLLLWMLPQSLLAAAPTYYTPKSMGGLSVGLRAPNIKADSTLVLPVFSSAPSISALRKGDLYYNTGDSTVYRCTGGSWAAIGLNGIIPVANGGTGVATLAANGVLYGNGTGVALVTAQGATNTILTASAGAPAFSASPTIGTSVTTPLHIGGTAAGSTLTLQSTSGIGTTDAILFTVGNNGATAAGRITDAGAWFMGTTTTNANTTNGLTIQQSGNDDEIITAKSSDIAHGMTTITETDSYFTISKVSAAGGGVSIQGFEDGGSSYPYSALQLSGFQGQTVDATHSASGFGCVRVRANIKSGSGSVAVGANGNLFTVDTASSTKFIVDAEGDLFADGSSVTVYDFDEDGRPRDDVAAISTLDNLHAQMSNRKIVDSEWEDYTKYNEQDLINMDILGGPRFNVDPKNRGLVNYTGLARLHNGAIRQLGRNEKETQSRVEELEAKNKILEERLARIEVVQLLQPIIRSNGASIFDFNFSNN